ncbi:MAG: N-acetylmuramoyl-L-alanine amidase [Micavibrio aeruginosavorus]|uniref:N-acetylmuramoyl-L-alanine amidase n=1 Tax=Micavibrio aeruginosavorus TaxID=349221 RepID=A0A2W5MXG2_9BACT|nr:MAG: N-acetylmuramoyl-L-alanine amidase [Micavibrio aeruginosavorus]
MARFFALFLLIFCVSAIPAHNVKAANDLSVNSLRIGSYADKTRIVIETSKKTDFRAFILQNPPRLVLDLPAFDWRASLPSSNNGELVGAIRNGTLQPGISRIVIDLKKQVTLKSAFTLPSGGGNSDRVVMDIAPVFGTYNPTNEKMFGSLNSSAPKQLPIAPPKSFETNPSHALNPPGSYAPSEEKASYVPAPEPPAPTKNGKKKMIVIDAGHGGQDPGALGANGKKEKDVTLATAQELKKQLEATGRYRVHLTRSTDVFIKLPDRVAIGRKQGADLFISLHADSIDKPGVSGASIYTLSNKASDAQTAKLAARENQADLIAGVDLSHEDKEVANILIDLAMRDTMNQSKFFANMVVKQAKSKGIQMLDQPHRFAGFAVLKAPDVPSVLIEMGFMSNKAEVNALSSPAYRQKIASAIVGGVDSYFSKVSK